MAAVLSAVLAMLATSAAVAASQAPARRIPAADAPPAAVVQAASAARYLFDAARDSNWDDVAPELAALQTAVTALPEDAGDPQLRRSIRMRTHDLATAIRRKRRIPAMEAANAVARFAAEVAQTYRTDTPAEIALLDYYGRQLQIGIAAHKQAVIKRAVADMRQAWEAVRPELERRGQTDDVRRLTDIVVTLEGARRPDDMKRLAQAELDEVGHLQTDER